MSESHEDDALREEFRALKADVSSSGRVPDFDAMMARARAEAADADSLATPDVVDLEEVRRTRITRVGGWMSVATAAAAAGVLMVGGAGTGTDADAEFERLVQSYSASVAAGTYASPTASLLHTPGVDLGGVPSIGGALRGFDAAAVRDGEGRDS